MAYPPEFTDVLATRIAEYTGRERADVLAVVRYAGDRLPDRVADLMLENLRAHLGEETAAERAAAELRSEQDRANDELIAGLDPDVATDTLALATRHGGPLPQPTARDEYASADRRLRAQLGQGLAAEAVEGKGFMHAQEARAGAEGVFAGAVRIVHPVATVLGEPRALQAEREARVDAAISAAGGLPPGRLERNTVAHWLDDADRRAERIRADPESRDEHVTAFAELVDRDLRRAAGDSEREKHRLSVMGVGDADGTLREGVAVAWAGAVRPGVLERLEVPAELTGAGSVALPERFEGQVAAAVAGSLAAQTGRGEAEVLDVLVAAGDRDRENGPQFAAGMRLLLPEVQLRAARAVDGHRPDLHVVWAMEDEFKRMYRDHDNGLDTSAESIGQAVVDAGMRTRDGWGLGPPEPDPDLQATVSLGLRPDTRGGTEAGSSADGRTVTDDGARAGRTHLRSQPGGPGGKAY